MGKSLYPTYFGLLYNRSVRKEVLMFVFERKVFNIRPPLDQPKLLTLPNLR